MKFTVETALKFTKRSIALMAFWPPPKNTSKIKLYLLDVYCCFILFCAQSVAFATMNGIHYYHDNFEIIMQCSCVVIASIQVTIKVIIGRLQRSSYQSIVEEMLSLIERATPMEKAVLEKYVNKASTLHLSVTIGVYAISAHIILGPLFLPQELPTYAVYPFDIHPHPTFEFVYFQHVVIGIECAAGQSIDNFVAVLLWFTGARFEMLEVEIANVFNESDLNRIIVKHSEILSFAERVVKTVRYVIFATVCITTVLIVFSGLLYFFTDSITVKSQFIFLDFLTAMQMFVNSYPAENLIQKSTDIGSAVFNLDWFDKSREMWQNVCFLIQRTQKPVEVTISGFIPAFSFTYYMSYLSSAFSYFTTLRAVVN